MSNGKPVPAHAEVSDPEYLGNIPVERVRVFFGDSDHFTVEIQGKTRGLGDDIRSAGIAVQIQHQFQLFARRQLHGPGDRIISVFFQHDGVGPRFEVGLRHRSVAVMFSVDRDPGSLRFGNNLDGSRLDFQRHVPDLDCVLAFHGDGSPHGDITVPPDLNGVVTYRFDKQRV